MTNESTLEINDETIEFFLTKSDVLGEIGLVYDKKNSINHVLVRIDPNKKELVISNLFDGFKIITRDSNNE